MPVAHERKMDVFIYLGEMENIIGHFWNKVISSLNHGYIFESVCSTMHVCFRTISEKADGSRLVRGTNVYLCWESVYDII